MTPDVSFVSWTAGDPPPKPMHVPGHNPPVPAHVPNQWSPQSSTKLLTKPQACAIWGIDSTLNLTVSCADFYLLYDLFLDGEDEGRFKPFIDALYPSVQGYTDMILGGEIRHGKAKLLGKAVPLMLAQALQTGKISSDRTQAWAYWKVFRNRHGTAALRWVETGFNLMGPGSFGGPKWGNIAKVLRLHETGELPTISFIDTCWGLQHNGGCYFNKIYQVGNLAAALEAGRKSDFLTLRAMAAPDIRELHTKYAQK